MEKSELQEALNEVMDARRRIDEETHVQHHQFIEMQVEKHKERQRVREAVKKQVIGWGLTVLLGGIGTAVYQYATWLVAKVRG